MLTYHNRPGGRAMDTAKRFGVIGILSALAALCVGGCSLLFGDVWDDPAYTTREPLINLPYEATGIARTATALPAIARVASGVVGLAEFVADPSNLLGELKHSLDLFSQNMDNRLDRLESNSQATQGDFIKNALAAAVGAGIGGGVGGGAATMRRKNGNGHA